ncbi:serine hydrolase [Methylobacterium sp. BTF04]|uniref:serine hydrolase n=1 Tax=Methylobacterium sp. BTF04 TaxID=2708300 RepID=UPI0013D27916|nr:serine hydrolase [Methylobacterium sp. BTF04]NEU11622.1 serine hydrolase [Methylobacterium sp. BTF04]
MTPSRLVALLLIVFALCAPAQAQDSSDFAEKAAALVDAAARAKVFSGAVIVARNGQPVFRRAYGPANREWDIANTPETRFRIGSITKQFTAAAILKLAESGKLSLDDAVVRHVPGLPASWGGMTIRMLLNHTSGLPNVTALPDYPSVLSRLERSPMETVALLFGEEMLFPPGTGYEYSSTGYILLAALIERVSGIGFEAYVAQELLAPAGLRATGDSDPGAVLPRRASGYHRVAGEWRNAPPLAASAPSGAGGLTATVDDLVAWDRALLSGQVLAPASLAAMSTDNGHGYGLGWYLGTAYGQRLWSHGGFINGFAAIKDTYPDLGLTIVVLGNTETTPAQTLSRTIAALYFGLRPETEIAVSDGVLDRYVGFYRIGPRSTLRLRREGDRLFAKATGLPGFALTPESDRVFSAPDGTRIAIDIEPDGRATGLMIHADDVDRSGPRIDPATARRITARRVARLPVP